MYTSKVGLRKTTYIDQTRCS